MTAIVASRQNFHHPDNTSDSNTENNTMHSTREPAKNVFVYLNGNRYYPGRKFVVNRRYLHDFNGFLTEVILFYVVMKTILILMTFKVFFDI